MERYLNELSISGIALLFIGVILGHTAGMQYGAWPCGLGLLLMLVIMVFKAWHWKKYERDNKRNILIVLLAIVLMYVMMLSR